MIPEELIQVIRDAQQIVVLTGAGISAESGVPTFREAQTGLWARYDPEDLATPQAFRREPRLVWDWYAWRRELVSKATPNPGHYALVEMEKRAPFFNLITQNVDGLHAQAGSRNLIELHGNLQRTKCLEENIVVSSWEETGEVPPRCPKCGAMLRPDVVWFGEMLPAQALNEALETTRKCNLFMSIGTSGLVQPAASLPYLASQNGAPVIEINPEETVLTSEVSYFLKGPSGVILPELVRAAWPEK